MKKFLQFVCPELDASYDAIYRELALYVDQSVESTLTDFPPDEAVVMLKYHRRQARRRQVAHELALELGVDAGVVFSATSPDGAQVLLDALRLRRPEGVLV